MSGPSLAVEQLPSPILLLDGEVVVAASPSACVLLETDPVGA